MLLNFCLIVRLEYLVESVSQSGITKLPTLKASSSNISTSLQVFQSEISALNTPLQGIQSSLSRFETRFETLETLMSQLVHQPAVNGSQQEVSSPSPGLQCIQAHHTAVRCTLR